MKTIWKFSIPIDPTGIAVDVFRIVMPKDAEIISLKIQNGKPFIWAIVDNSAELTTRRFFTTATGSNIGQMKKSSYIGTFMVAEFVWHLFERDIL